MCKCVNVRMWLCMYVVMYVCIYMDLCMYVFMYVCLFVCIYSCMYLCIYVCMYACMYVCMCVYVCICVCMCVCLYVCMSVCMYIVCEHMRWYSTISFHILPPSQSTSIQHKQGSSSAFLGTTPQPCTLNKSGRHLQPLRAGLPSVPSRSRAEQHEQNNNRFKAKGLNPTTIWQFNSLLVKITIFSGCTH